MVDSSRQMDMILRLSVRVTDCARCVPGEMRWGTAGNTGSQIGVPAVHPRRQRRRSARGTVLRHLSFPHRGFEESSP